MKEEDLIVSNLHFTQAINLLWLGLQLDGIISLLFTSSYIRVKGKGSHNKSMLSRSFKGHSKSFLSNQETFSVLRTTAKYIESQIQNGIRGSVIQYKLSAILTQSIGLLALQTLIQLRIYGGF